MKKENFAEQLGEAIKQDEAEPEPEALDELEAVVWATLKHSHNYCPVLSRRAPLDIAKRFTSDMLTLHAEGKQPRTGTYFYQEDWWQWNGAFYDKAPEQRLIDMICNFLDKAKAKSDGEGETLTRFKPTRDLSGVVTFLRSNVGLDDRITPPRWLDERGSPDATNLLAFRNCLVDVATGKTYPHEPWLWMHDGVDFKIRWSENYDRPIPLVVLWPSPV